MVCYGGGWWWFVVVCDGGEGVFGSGCEQAWGGCGGVAPMGGLSVVFDC